MRVTTFIPAYKKREAIRYSMDKRKTYKKQKDATAI
jgi:hypothetical protein